MIFGDSDEEGTKDIDFLGIDEDDEESDEVNSESGNEGASDSDSEEEEEWWTTDLSNIVVDKFSAQSGIVVKMGVNPKADDFFGLMFDEDLFEKIKEETHHYACHWCLQTRSESLLCGLSWGCIFFPRLPTTDQQTFSRAMKE